MVLKLARARSTKIHQIRLVFGRVGFGCDKRKTKANKHVSCLVAVYIYQITESIHLHLLSLGASGGSAAIGFDKSSKLIMYNEISSTSERIGAMTSEQRNVVPVQTNKRK